MRVIYRMYDADDRLLYVGCTGNLTQRLDQHRRRQPWAHEIARVHVTDCASLPLPPFTSEQFIITHEHPLYNRSLADGRRRAVEAARRSHDEDRWCGRINCRSCRSTGRMRRGLDRGQLVAERPA